MAIFISYVKLPEGNNIDHEGYTPTVMRSVNSCRCPRDMSSTEGTAGIAAPSGTPLDTTGAVTSFTKKQRSYKAPAATF